VGFAPRAVVAQGAEVTVLAALALAAGTWTGTYRLPVTADPVPIVVKASGTHAYVSLGPGHAGRQRVAYRNGTFTLPGGVTFSHGVVRQGKLRGTYTLKRGTSRVLPALGLYRGPNDTGAAIVQAEGLPTWRVDLPSGDVHWLKSAPSAPKGFTRVALRQREVRVGQVAATLTLPPGRGPFPAVVMTHGSGPQGRDEFQVFAAYCELLGIAVIADDKRGVGQSQGRYPGDAATPTTIDVLARDAQAEARYLATLPEIDTTKIGVLGDSQAGWIIALAAAREKLFRWAVPLVGPTITVGESDAWGNLAGKGQYPPTASKKEMIAKARAARGGFDPVPSLRKLGIPVHWVFARDDRNVPTDLCIESLEELEAGHDFTWDVVDATHTLFELPSGLNKDIPRSRGFASGLFPSVGAFLRRIGVAS
jgi:pimeloyl-ACP methyl ester carboxylesterase